jgi:integrase
LPDKTKGGFIMLVRLRTRPSRDGRSFKYGLDYVDENGKRKQVSLGHADKRKAERQRAQKERELRMGIVEPESMKLGDFLKDSIKRTRGQVRESTLVQQEIAMKHLIRVVGNVDYLNVSHRHGERFIQTCLDEGNSPATVNKKIRSIKRLFQLAIDRGQLEENPFKRVRKPKTPRGKVRVYSDEECANLIKSGLDYANDMTTPWGLLITVALCTGMRRGELLNTTWQDIDFDKQFIEVSPKKNTSLTWEWHIKDNERRTLPLTDEVVFRLTQHRTKEAKVHPYVFIPPYRYEHIQQLRKDGKWTVRHGMCPVNNFTRQFRAILNGACVETGQFHDLRRTCLTRWLFNGLSAYDVMNLAGHADFDTTRRFYLAVREDLLQRAREASKAAMNGDFVAHLWRTPEKEEKGKSSSGISA